MASSHPPSNRPDAPPNGGLASSGPSPVSSRFEPAAPSRSGVCVLLVEDGRVNRAVADVMLRRLGYTCDVAETGAQAVAMARERPYDLVFMDVQMPDMDGFEATRRIHAELGPRSPYIVAMTANAQPGDRERCMAAGMDDYLVKPARLDALANLLEPGRP